jgi:hypothetical protein
VREHVELVRRRHSTGREHRDGQGADREASGKRRHEIEGRGIDEKNCVTRDDFALTEVSGHGIGRSCESVAIEAFDDGKILVYEFEYRRAGRIARPASQILG